MPKTAPVLFRCTDCAAETPKWLGRCPQCRAWGTLEQSRAPVVGARARASAPVVPAPAIPIAEVDGEIATARPTGLAELDRVLGGGLVPGGVVLVAGEPGVGKSTLLLAAAAQLAESGLRVLVVTGEESPAQVRNRAERVGALSPRLLLAAEIDLPAVLATVAEVGPDVLIVDSVQTMVDPAMDGAAGGVAQVRHAAATFVNVAKQSHMSTLLIGHVTKDGSVAGPRALEHVVDVVLQAEGERGSTLRLLRAVKNRFGPTDEVGCFELTATGVRDVTDPSGLFISRPGSAPDVPGACVTVTLEGRRPLVAEVQALVSKSEMPNPRRAVSGLDASRMAMLLAVADRRLELPVLHRDVYASAVGGVKLGEPGSDLALALAIISSAYEKAIPVDLIAVGEVGLAGEIRPVPAVPQRLAAAHRLGFRRALVPPGGGPAPDGMRVQEVTNLAQATHWATSGAMLSPSQETRRIRSVR